jgi:chromosome segregation ATPase
VDNKKAGRFLYMVDNKNNNLQGEVWTEDDDVKLAEVVLRRVREGDSVIDACREFEDITNGRRTASASKFRWHTRLKDKYSGAYNIAKDDGKKVRDYKRRKVNQGERYQDIVENILEKNMNRDITLDDILVVVKHYKKQEEEKGDIYDKYEKDTDKLRRENNKLKKELDKTVDKLTDTKSALLEIDGQYKKLMDALKVLKEAGIAVNVPEPENIKYLVNKDGTVEKM